MLGDGEIIDTYLVEKREGVDTKSDKYDIGRRECSKKRDVCHTNSSMYFFL